MSTRKDINELNIKQLNKNIAKFFPKEGYCSLDNYKNSKEYNINNLPFNLNNYAWLAKMLQIQSGLPNKYYSDILDYIDTSTFFEEELHNYALRVVKCKIQSIKSGLGGFCDDEPNCDISFRECVVDNLLTVGIDRETIEEGLEMYSNIWRDYYIDKAFKLEFEPMINIVETKKPSKEHKKAWIKYRNYEYYQNHKNYVDLYGKCSKNMNMTYQEAKDLKNYLIEKNSERIKYLADLENNIMLCKASEIGKIMVNKCLDRGIAITTYKLEKLLAILQVVSIKESGYPLFGEEIILRDNSIMIDEVDKDFLMDSTGFNNKFEENITLLKSEMLYIDSVLDFYGKLNSYELNELLLTENIKEMGIYKEDSTKVKCKKGSI